MRWVEQDLRVSAEHRPKSHVRAQVPQDFDEWHRIPPGVVVGQCALPNWLPLIAMSPAILFDARAQLLQLHVHAGHICLANR